MKKYIFISLSTFVGFSSFSQNTTSRSLAPKTFVESEVVRNHKPKNYTTYVNPFIGTGGHGHTYPGASAPFGMMQLSPDTRYEGWDGCSGYHYSDSIIFGFSHTHLSGTGVPDYCDLLVVPQVGKAKTTPGYKDPAGYGAHFSHKNEIAHPGYYAVKMDNDIHVELTVSERSGMHHYTFPENATEKYILLDLDHRDKLILGEFDIIHNGMIEGTRISQGWAIEQHFYFSMLFSTQFVSKEMITINNQHKLLLRFPDDMKELYIKVGMSAVDKMGARKNHETEITNWDFESVRQLTKQSWENELQKIEISQTTENNDQLTNFYTALYHSFLNPNLFSDIDGRYRGRDNKIHTLNAGEKQYTVFSLWDTYRGAHPLYTIVQQDRTKDFINTFIRQFEQGGDLPVWELAGNETECMIGYHSVSVIADAYLKNVPGIDIKPLLKAVVATSNFDEYGKMAFNKNGFIGVGDEPESVSRTLEYAYDSYCIYQILKKAKSEGHDVDDALIENYLLRSFNFINSFDPQTGFMRGRKEGIWFSPFKPDEVNFNYTEANSWQYSMDTPHAIGTLSTLLGGKDSLENWLDRLFTTSSELSGREQSDITGLIGQYAHGNEPSHHMAYLYNYTSSPWKTAIYVDSILNHYYFNAPDGLSGNEDCGQMSAWYVLSSLGFYPISPGNPNYELGRPLCDRAIIHLENGKLVHLEMVNNNSTSKYIETVTFNRNPIYRNYILQEELMKGGNWTVIMSDKARMDYDKWSSAPTLSDVPEKFIPVPYFDQTSRIFDSKMTISLNSAIKSTDFLILYTTDGADPTIKNAKKFDKPFKISKTTVVKAAIYNTKLGKLGHIITNEFTKKELGVSLKLESEFANQYAAEGSNTLIDGIKGSTDYRTGEWQGYYAQDFKATLNFEKPKKLKSIGINALQGIRSWIYPFKEVVFEITYSDNTTETKTVELSRELSETEYNDSKIESYIQKLDSRAVKQIKITGKNYGKNPKWHESPGFDTWFFVDEIFYE